MGRRPDPVAPRDFQDTCDSFSQVSGTPSLVWAPGHIWLTNLPYQARAWVCGRAEWCREGKQASS